MQDTFKNIYIALLIALLFLKGKYTIYKNLLLLRS